MPCQKSVLVGYFVCHEKCDTTLPFFLLIPMGKPLSATSKPQPFQFIAYLLFLNSSSFTTSLLNFCFTGRKSQQTAVSGNTACLFKRQMCQWLLLRNACSCLCNFCCYLNGVFCLFVCFPCTPSNSYGLYFFKNNSSFLPFHVRWMLICRFFRNERKSRNCLHILPLNKLL